MAVKQFIVFLFIAAAFLAFTAASPAQNANSQGAQPLEVSDDGLPVLLYHLPDFEKVKTEAKFINSTAALREIIGERSVLSAIDFVGGTEAVTAVYPEGRLLIVEYTNPQSSIDADQRIVPLLGQNSISAYRRIGNYNALVFDGDDEDVSNELLDQITYQKSVQWLGEDPFLVQKLERYFVTTTRDIFISTVMVIVGGLVAAIFAGIIAGFLYFRFRDQRRARTAAFSDAGGLTRLNLDELT